MSVEEYSRHFDIEFAGNIRDLGGYRTIHDRRVAWRRVFRSGELRHKTGEDVASLKLATGLVSVLDLRGDTEVREESVRLLTADSIRYHNVPLMRGKRIPTSDTLGNLLKSFTNMGEVYLYLMDNENFSKKMVEALEFIADSENQPVLFHCTLGKDRTGILSSAVLSILGVADEDIVTDYHLTTPYMVGVLERRKDVLPPFPTYYWETSRASMKLVLSEVRRKYGSFRDYLIAHGCGEPLFEQLESTLLEKD